MSTVLFMFELFISTISSVIYLLIQNCSKKFLEQQVHHYNPSPTHINVKLISYTLVQFMLICQFYNHSPQFTFLILKSILSNFHTIQYNNTSYQHETHINRLTLSSRSCYTLVSIFYNIRS